MAHQYQVAINYINEHGKREKPVRPTHIAYKMLKWLADAKGVPMNGARMQVAGLNRMSPKTLNRKAREVLVRFCETGVFELPDLFNVRKGDGPAVDHKGSLYMHDRDETANRNLWAQSSGLKRNKAKMLQNTASHGAGRSVDATPPPKVIKNPGQLAYALAYKHKRGEIVLGQRVLMTVAATLDKRASDAQVRVMVSEAKKNGIKLGFRPRYM